MKLTIEIDINNSKALALLNYIKTLDFISISEDENPQEYKLNREQISIIQERRQKHLDGTSKSYSWEEIKEDLNG